MRLKGGKVLLDLTGYGSLYTDTATIEHPLSDEEIECIKTKGLDVKVIFAGHTIVWNLPLREYVESDDIFKTTIYANGSEYASFALDIDNKKLLYQEL